MIAVRFDPQAAVEAVLYIAYHSKDPSFHHISKLLYFADRLHLERYGRLIFGDTYIAMKHGPVPSGVYDMLKDARQQTGFYRYPQAGGAFTIVKDYCVQPGRPANLEWLSDSDIECIDETIAQYDHKSFAALTELSHDEAWDAADLNDAISLESIVQSLGNPDDLLSHLLEPSP